MAFFQDIGNALSDACKSVENKATEVMEVNKINNRITEKKKDINSAYNEIGKLVYEKFKAGIYQSEEFSELCEKIASYENELSDLNSRLNAAKGCKVCPNCGNSCNATANFCNKCGEQL